MGYWSPLALGHIYISLILMEYINVGYTPDINVGYYPTRPIPPHPAPPHHQILGEEGGAACVLSVLCVEWRRVIYLKAGADADA